MNYDEKCYDLAEEFVFDSDLDDKERHCHLLASAIQQTIEDYLETEEERERKRA